MTLSIMNEDTPASASDTPTSEDIPQHLTWNILAILAGVCFGSTLLFNEYILSLFHSGAHTDAGTRDAIRYSQLWFFILAILTTAAAIAVKRTPPHRSPFSKPGRTEALLAVLTLVFPLIVFELVARPFAKNPQKTWIFMKDDELDWKLRPNSSDMWGGVKVHINGKGVRGPEFPYHREEEAYRILYLGDSVTFGYGIEKDADTYPYRVEKILEETANVEVETINAGVGGYSPWQELIYLKREGIRYQPDLVCLGFYLNDVTEKFKLARFGGKLGSYQLNHAYRSIVDRWLRWSGGWAAIKQLNARLRFGENIQEGAEEIEVMKVETMIREPDRPDIANAWEVTLGNVSKIVDYCRAKKTDLLLIVFPDQVQLEDPTVGTSPQEILNRFAEERDLEILDLLPLLKSEIESRGVSSMEWYKDHSHPSASGVKIIAPLLAERIHERFLPPSG